MIKAIFFDLDNTLCNCIEADDKTFKLVETLALENEPGINTESLKNSFFKILGQIPFDPEGIIPVTKWREKIWQQALMAQNIEKLTLAKKLNQFFLEKRLEFYKFDPGVEDFLNKIKCEYKIVLITNGDSDIQRPKIDACKAELIFGKNILVGGEEEKEKPHKSIFYKACSLVSCSPNEAIHVGDSLTKDIQGGINSGLAATVWIENSYQSKDDIHIRSDFTIKSVLLLTEILKQY